MKLKTFELLDNSAVTRMFVSKTVTLDSQIVIRDKRVKVTDLDEDSLGRVWVNKGLYVISAASLAYTVPVEGEAEWGARFGQREGWNSLREKLATPGDAGHVDLGGREAYACHACDFNAKDARGMAAHVRAKHP